MLASDRAWTGLAAVAMAAVALGCGDSDGAAADARPADAAAVPDAARVDAMTNVSNYTRPYTCDEDTLALYHFDGSDPLGDACGTQVGQLNSGATGEVDGGMAPGMAQSRQFFGAASQFDGTGVLAAEGLNTTAFLSELTVEAWIFPTLEPTTSVEQTIVGSYNKETLERQFWLGLEVGGPPEFAVARFFIHDASCFNATLMSVLTTVPLDEWSHVKANVTSTQLRLSLNNSQVASIAVDAPLCNGAATRLTVGALGNTSGGAGDYRQGFHGLIDEVRISSVAR